MNIVYCVYRTWSLKILQGLLAVQDKKDWKIKLVIAPEGMELPKLPVEVMHIDPTKLGAHEEKIKSLKPGVIITYGWSWIIPKNILDIAPCLVLHPSKLPHGRGGTPIQNQIMEGIKKSAVSIIYAIDKLDAGDILEQEEISFEGYVQDIFDRMSETGLKLSIPLMDKFLKGYVKGTPQDSSKATIYRRRTPDMSEITLDEIKTKNAEHIYNKIRGLQDPYPEAYIICADGKKLYITRAHL